MTPRQAGITVGSEWIDSYQGVVDHVEVIEVGDSQIVVRYQRDGFVDTAADVESFLRDFIADDVLAWIECIRAAAKAEVLDDN